MIPRRTALLLAAAAAAGAVRYWRWRNGEPERSATVKRARKLMGTLWTVEVSADGRTEDARAAIERAMIEIDRIESLMSEWIAGSPVSRINRAAGVEAVEVPEELARIIRRALEYSGRTGGAFDISWRGMGNVWRFDEEFKVPEAKAVEAARRNVDYRAVRVEGNRVRLERKGMAIGLGGIAKGYAVDRAAAVLRDAGFTDTLVAGAGDMLASGTKGGRPWRLGVQDPRGERGAILGTVELSDRAISTSGDYERFRIADGVRYHHIIDPRTGWPARECQSATVAARSAEESDVLATAIFVLGPVKGLELALNSGADTLIVDAAGKRLGTSLFASML
jgi:thiamine biosynthesis lipoprotein